MIYLKHAIEQSPILTEILRDFNDDFIGGITRFIPDELYSVKSNIDLWFSQGTAIIFPHNYLHEGTKVENKPKYILRSDIMFVNSLKANVNEQEAFNLVREAGKMESKDPNKAAKLYRKAFRLCPEIEKYV
ncbi:Hypothetical protein HVR_LOCUS132 [uncultured virus]|nr:Hypothetical protein HVR_LOCUS132 [uncultured virus]